MGLTSIPTETDGSLGIDKEDISPRPNSRHYVSAAEHNTLKTAVREMAVSLGLGDGTTDGSLEQLRRWVSSLERARDGSFAAFDDFLSLDTGIWTKTETSLATVTALSGDATAAGAADGGAGLVELATLADAADEAGISAWTSINGGHLPRFEARIKTPSDVSGASLLRAGLGNASLTGSFAVIYPSAGAWVITAASADGGTQDTDSGLGSVSADTWYEVAIDIESGAVRYYVDGSLIGSITTSTSIPNANDKLGAVCMLTNNDATAFQAFVDWVGVRGSRL